MSPGTAAVRARCNSAILDHSPCSRPDLAAHLAQLLYFHSLCTGLPSSTPQLNSALKTWTQKTSTINNSVISHSIKPHLVTLPTNIHFSDDFYGNGRNTQAVYFTVTAHILCARISTMVRVTLVVSLLVKSNAISACFTSECSCKDPPKWIVLSSF